MTPRTLLFLLFALSALSACTHESASSRLEREMHGAYPTEASPTGVVRDFAITAAPGERAPLSPGGTPLAVWSYNGTTPGPTLRVRLGETVRVAFSNHLPDETTIHWHGVRVPNGMDGVPHATQPPVAPGGTFVYEFTPKDAGTFWFHPHVRSSEQVERGLYGVLIVEDREPPPYAQDVVWVLDDWLLGADRQLDTRFNTPHDLMHDGRWGNVVTVNGRTDTTLAVRAGDRIRLRLLNASNGRIYVPDLAALGDGVRIIAVDGLYLRAPIPPGRFELAPGNRVDLDVTFAGAESRVIPIRDTFTREGHTLATILVDDIAPPAPAFPSPAHAVVPTWADALATPVTHELRLAARRGGPFGLEWTLNGVAFAGHEAAAPAAHAAHDHASFRLPRGRFAHLRFVNESARLHPIHLHGMFFKLLARNGTPVDEGFFRDTVLVHGKETVDVGLVPLDAGSWMLHCHILEHAEAGMMTMIAVD